MIECTLSVTVSSSFQSMFAIGWLELKEVKRAQQQMSKCFSNITEPFK
ncbi:hypothetical protein E2320_020872, partial [Naja naja]